MPKYKVSLEGKNFQIDIDNAVQQCGFFTTRFVEANDLSLAEQEAMDLVREELNELVLNDRKNPPIMYIAQLDEIQSFGNNQVPGTGFTWFKESAR